MELNEETILVLLRREIARHGSKGGFARAHDLPHTTISMAVNNSAKDNRRRFPDSLLAALGVRRREVYELVETREEAA